MSKWQTIGEVYRQASSFLGSPFEAELLLRKMMNLDRASFYLQLQEPFPPHLLEKWQEWLSKRKAHQPIQYIIGEQEFYGRVFEVDSSVLIPRPETEMLIEKVLERIDQCWSQSSPCIVDLGTGSGAIAITLAAERPHLRVIATDCSPQALQVAERNAHRHGVRDRIAFMQGDFLTPLRDQLDGMDIVVSNPPYIPSHHINQLESQVRDFEPWIALDGGPDGLIAYRKIVSQLHTWHGWVKKILLAFEIGHDQKDAVTRLLHSYVPNATIDSHQDLAGNDRIIIAQVV